MTKSRSNRMETFASLFSDERSEEPREYLLNLWETDREEFVKLFETAVYESTKYRGMIECISSVAIHVGNGSLREVLEKIVAQPQLPREVTNRLSLAAMQLGSEKAKNTFKTSFERAFSMGLDDPKYDDVVVANYLKYIALTNYKESADLIKKFLAHKQEQYHRKKQHLKLSPRKLKRLQEYDYMSVKFAEAIHDYFINGPDRLREYLNTIDNQEDRAYCYLYCLACNKDKNDYEYFMEYYNRHKDARLKSTCLEALNYIGPEEKALSVLVNEIYKFNFNDLLSKCSYDFGIVVVRRHPQLFYDLLELCFYLDSLNEQLVNLLQKLRGARDRKIASLASVILYKHHKDEVDKKDIDKNTMMLLQYGSSPADLLSLKKAVKKLF